MSNDVLDIAVAQYVKKTGMATPEQVVAAMQAQSESAARGAHLSLAEALVHLGVITPGQKETVEKKAGALQSGSQQLGHFRLLKKLGEGGMGAVYLAEDAAAGNRKVALKVLPKRFAAQAEFLKRFKREADAATTLDHDNIVRAFSVGEDLGFHYYVMEYCDGEPLDAVLRREGPMAVERAVGLALQVARGLKYAHDHGFIHRDVKPGNVILTKQGAAKLLDLGLSKNIAEAEQSFRTVSGAVIGTPHYISPEQAKGEKNVDGRTDVYSLGATLYHLLTGQTPFEGTTLFEILTKHVHQELPNPQDVRDDIPDNVVQVLRKMMAKEPKDRYADCGELIVDLQEAAAGRAPKTELVKGAVSSVALRRAATGVPRRRPASLRRGGAPAVRRSRAPLLIAGAAGAAALVAMILVLGGASKPARREPAAPEVRRPVPPVPPSGDGWVSLFNGTDFEGWEVTEGKPTVMDGAILLSRNAAEVGREVASADFILRGKFRLISVERDNKVGGIYLRRTGRAGAGPYLLYHGDGDVHFFDESRVLKAKSGVGKVAMGEWHDFLLVVKGELASLEVGGRSVVQAGLTARGAGRVSLYSRGGGAGLAFRDLWLRVVEAAPPVKFDPASFAREAASLPPEEQTRRVRDRLKELNPAFDGELTPKIEGGRVVELTFSSTGVSDVSPVAALVHLRVLRCRGKYDEAAGAYARTLSNLKPLEGLKLDRLYLSGTRVSDLSPLGGMSLQLLDVNGSEVSDLKPLRGMPLKRLYVRDTKVTDLAPIRGLPLKDLEADLDPVRDGPWLKALASLETLNGKPAASFLSSAPPAAPDAFAREVATLAPAEQARRVVARLREINPRFDGDHDAKVDEKGVRELSFVSSDVTDLSPLRALPHLRVLKCPGRWNKKTGGFDQGLADLSPLNGMRLRELGCGGSRVSDLSPLVGMPLEVLDVGGSEVEDLSPIRDLPLSNLTVTGAKVRDLSPLKAMKLGALACEWTSVETLAPLEGQKIEILHIRNTKIQDLSPLRSMSIKHLRADVVPARDAATLRTLPGLLTVNDEPAAEFWKKRGGIPSPDVGLVGHWTFDEGQGIQAGDQSGRGHHARLVNGPRWVPGVRGTALEFDGSDAHAELPNSALLDKLQNGSFSLTAWYKPLALPSEKDERDGGHSILLKPGFHTGLNIEGQGVFKMHHSLAGNRAAVAASTRRAVPGRFHFLAGVVNREAGRIELYLDGKLEAGPAWEGKTPSFDYGGTTWRMGIMHPGWRTFRWSARGVLDEARLYNRALSAAEVEALGRAPGPEAGWRPVFDGRTNDCLRKPTAWTVERGALSKPDQKGSAQTVEEFGDGELRVRFEGEALEYANFTVRQNAQGGGYFLELNRSHLDALKPGPHELLFACRGAEVAAALDGAAVGFRRKTPSARGCLQFNGVGKTLRILAIDYRPLP